jgi:hypothetical protein
MAPLMMIEIPRHDHAFCNERFTFPLQQELETMQFNKPKKLVQFSRETSKVINPETAFYTDRDIRIKWFGMDELGDIKQAAKDMSIVIRRKSKEQHCFLTMAHRKTSLILAADFKALIRLPTSTPDSDLQGWCAYADGRRGLERFASKDYSLLRRKDIIKTRKTVLAEQEKQKKAENQDPETIAKLARESSRRARTFALFFGAADRKELTNNRHEGDFERRTPPRKRSRIEHSVPFAILRT